MNEASINPLIGPAVKRFRKDKGWTQALLAHHANTNQPAIARIEKGTQQPSVQLLKNLAKALDVSINQLTDRTPDYDGVASHRNPKPIKLGNIVLSEAYRLCADLKEGLNIAVRYRHDIRIPPFPSDVYEQLALDAICRAKENLWKYHNGPNTRLIRINFNESRQLPTGKEETRLVLEMGPTSWEEFTVLNTNLDRPVLEGGKTPRSVFAEPRRLFSNTVDLSWCELSNLLTVHIVLITSDGYGLFHTRDVVSTDRGQYTSGICENIHRFIDDAPEADLHLRLNEMMTPIEGSQIVDHRFAPTGVPSPYLAAVRGISEEVSTKLYEQVNSRDVKFLGVVFDLRLFNPHLVGVLHLKQSREQLRSLIDEYPGADVTEAAEFHFISLNASAPETESMILAAKRWHPAGFAALAFAIRHWESCGRDER